MEVKGGLFSSLLAGRRKRRGGGSNQGLVVQCTAGGRENRIHLLQLEEKSSLAPLI